MSKTSKHDTAVHDLMLHPYLLGIENVIFRSAHSLWTPEQQGQIELETDAFFFTGSFYDFPYHLLEYKSNPNRRQKAIDQLYKGRKFVQRHFKSDAYLYFAFIDKGKYVVEPYGRNKRKR